MNIGQHIISNILTEKASIDWNNYLTSDEVSRFISKDDKVESAEDIIYDKNFKDRFQEFKQSGWTKRDLVHDLENFYNKGHLNESIDNLWKSQIDNKDEEQLYTYLDKLYKKLMIYDNKESKSNDFYNLLDKINYIEDKIGVKPRIGRILR